MWLHHDNQAHKTSSIAWLSLNNVWNAWLSLKNVRQSSGAALKNWRHATSPLHTRSQCARRHPTAQCTVEEMLLARSLLTS